MCFDFLTLYLYVTLTTGMLQLKTLLAHFESPEIIQRNVSVPKIVSYNDLFEYEQIRAKTSKSVYKGTRRIAGVSVSSLRALLLTAVYMYNCFYNNHTL